MRPLRVSLRWGPDEAEPVGRLAWRDRHAWFEFDAAFLARALPLSPFRLPSRAGLHEAPLDPFEGLFGVFSDSLPDAWGRLLLDRYVRRLGRSPAALTPLDRLAWVGQDGLGALVYEPEEGPAGSTPALDLDEIAEQSRVVLAGEGDDALLSLLRLGGSPQGARPKALVWLDPEALRLATAPFPGARPCLIKFPAQGDGPDSGAIEFAYHGMARAAGIEVPDAWLLPSQRGPGWFAVQRFDRTPGSERLHVHTLCGLLHADHRLPSLDYRGALAAVARLCGDHRAVGQLVRRMMFNVVAHNRDDHTKQVTVRMDRAGAWSLAPAYDLTFAEGPGGEHAMAVDGRGRPTRADLLRTAEAAGISRRAARAFLDEVEAGVARWPELASAAGVGAARIAELQQRFATVG